MINAITLATEVTNISDLPNACLSAKTKSVNEATMVGAIPAAMVAVTNIKIAVVWPRMRLGIIS
ncbi:hypothetical protein D3C75_1308180 [compost metagenome]